MELSIFISLSEYFLAVPSRAIYRARSSWAFLRGRNEWQDHAARRKANIESSGFSPHGSLTACAV